MRDEVRNALQKLSKLDLSTSSCDEAKSLIRQFGKIGTIIETLHEGKVIVRARPNYNGERFHKRSELSYRPQEYNKTFQRASTPNRTMFYGTSIPDMIQDGESLSGFKVLDTSASVPLSVDWFAYHNDWTGGSANYAGNYNPVFFGTASLVPELETYAMLLAGLGLLGFMARRRKESAA